MRVTIILFISVFTLVRVQGNCGNKVQALKILSFPRIGGVWHQIPALSKPGNADFSTMTIASRDNNLIDITYPRSTAFAFRQNVDMVSKPVDGKLIFINTFNPEMEGLYNVVATDSKNYLILSLCQDVDVSTVATQYHWVYGRSAALPGNIQATVKQILAKNGL